MYKVAIIEDVAQIRTGMVFSTDWASMDCIVVGQAEDGESGLTLIRRAKPDIVITDIKMPGLDGLQMLQRQPPGARFEAIVLSGFDEFDLVKRALQLGVIDYLLKPVDEEELIESIGLAKGRLARWRTHQQQSSELESLSLAHQFIDSMPTPPSALSPHVQDMISFVHENYMHRIQLRDLASHVNVSSNYLNTKFKAEIGTTFNDYLNQYRIQRAVQLLLTGSKVYVVASQVGIPDYKYFVKVFKKYVGSSPHELQVG